MTEQAGTHEGTILETNAQARQAATERLAQIHYQSDDCIAVYACEPAEPRTECRVSDWPALPAIPPEPIRLLEINQDTVPTPGEVVPLAFSPIPEQGIEYPSQIVEVTPCEYNNIIRGELPLPRGWERRRFIRREVTPEPKPADPPRPKTSCEIRRSMQECEDFLKQERDMLVGFSSKALDVTKRLLRIARQLPFDLEKPSTRDGNRIPGGIKLHWIVGQTRVELELWPNGDVQLHIEDDYEGHNHIGSEMLTLGWNMEQETAWLP